MADRPDVASYKLAADTGDFVGPMKAAAAASNELAGAVEKSDVAIEKRGKTVKFSSDYFERQERKLSDAARIEYQYAKAIADAQKARAAGIGTEQSYGNVIDLLNEKRRRAIEGLAIQDAAMRKSATSTGLARYELINLSRQFQDIGVSLAGGQSPFRILIEQGSQIADVFASSKAAFGDLWQSMVSGIARFGGSAAGLAVGLMAIGAAGAAAALHWQEGQRVIEQALAGIGRRSGTTVAQINQIAESVSETTRLSTAQAREIASGFAGTGEMFSGSIKAATELTDKFALAMGKSAVEGGKELAAILKNVETGAGQLDKIFGILDDKTQQYIVSLVRQNHEEEARLLLIAKARPIIEDVANATSFWARAWMSVSGAASQAADSIGKAIDKGLKFASDVLPAWRGPQIGAAAAQISSGVQGLFADKGTMAKDLGLDDLNKMKTATEQAAAAQKAYNARLDEYSKQAGEAVRATIPQIEAVSKLQGQLEDLERAQKDAQISGRMKQADQLQPAIDATKLQIQLQKESQAETARHVTAVTELAAKYQGVSSAVAMMLDQLRAQTAIAQAAPGPEKQAVEDAERFNQLRLEGKSIEEATLVTVAERRNKYAQVGAAIEEQNHALKQSSDLARASVEGRADEVRVEQAITNARRAGADAAGQQAAAEGQAKANAEARLTREIQASREYESQLASITARTQAERSSAAGLTAYNQALNSGLSTQEAMVAQVRAEALEREKLRMIHKDNMASLQDQLKIAQARTEQERLAAQEQATTNQRMREGASAMEASEEAALQRKIAQEAINQRLVQQMAAQAVAAARLAEEMEKAAEAAYRMFVQMGQSLLASGKMSNSVAELAAKLEAVGRGGTGGGSKGVPIGGWMLLTPYMPSLAQGSLGSMTPPALRQQRELSESFRDIAKTAIDAAMKEARAGIEGYPEYAAAQEEAAQALKEAADKQKEAAETLMKAQQEWFSENVAQQLISGVTPQAINQMIESGQLRIGTPEQIFKTQLDLYKRAGMSNAQILADIRAGFIGEGVRPTELLAAIDSLTGAVESNTAAQIGLSDFYTQQGDRLLGYRGYNVPSGIRPSGVVGGAGGGGTGALPGALPGGMPGAIPNPVPPYVVPPFPPTGVPGTDTGGGGQQILRRYLGGRIVEGYYNVNGTWTTTRVVGIAPGITTPPDTYGEPVGSIGVDPNIFRAPIVNPPSGSGGYPSSSTFYGSNYYLSGLSRTAYSRFAEGGIVDRPRMAMIGEAGPEAFVPLKGGAIPVRLMGAANNNQPTTVVNINAPLVNFMAEPTRDEVRESAFQASQMLRRVAAGG